MAGSNRSLFTVTIPAEGIKKLVLNYEGIIPEYNQRNNYKNVQGFLNRPLQVTVVSGYGRSEL